MEYPYRDKDTLSIKQGLAFWPYDKSRLAVDTPGPTQMITREEAKMLVQYLNEWIHNGIDYIDRIDGPLSTL